jgi:Zn-dependent protease with chaperone function
MIYNNLLFFLVAIFLFTVTNGADEPSLSWPAALGLLSCLLFFYDRMAKRLYVQAYQKGSTAYFSVEKRLSLLALCCYAIVLFICDAHHYLNPLSLGERLPSLVNIGGLALFFLFLLLMWRRARPAYSHIFGRSYSNRTFLLSNTRANLPIVLPWITLSLTYDLLALLPFPQLTPFLHSEFGEYASFILFLFLVLVFFPPLVRRLWGCTPFPEGELLDHLHNFFKQQKFSAKVFIWPLFEGKVITAGVMGIIPGLRYVMITPALLESLSRDELDAVMAHEIGHIKNKHMLLYLLIISGFSILAGVILEPLTYLLLSRSSFYAILTFTGLSAENLLTTVMGAFLLGSMLLYFRFLFGYFIRNFERQADLHVFKAIGTSDSIISAFEKIAILSGNIRDLPSWHHFGIGQRVDFLESCNSTPIRISRHNRKVWLSLLLYILCVGGIALGGQNLLPSDTWKTIYEEKYTEHILERKLEREPDKALWLGIAGDLMQHKKMERKAISAYNKALALEPGNPKLLNNLAWLLLTSDDPTLRDPQRALELSRRAAIQVPAANVLDTLAMAYWANGFINKGITTERQALFLDPERSDYYKAQIHRFGTEEYRVSGKSASDE